MVGRYCLSRLFLAYVVRLRGHEMDEFYESGKLAMSNDRRMMWQRTNTAIQHKLLSLLGGTK